MKADTRLLVHIDKQRFSPKIQCSYEVFYEGGAFLKSFSSSFSFSNVWFMF